MTVSGLSRALPKSASKLVAFRVHKENFEWKIYLESIKYLENVERLFAKVTDETMDEVLKYCKNLEVVEASRKFSEKDLLKLVQGLPKLRYMYIERPSPKLEATLLHDGSIDVQPLRDELIQPAKLVKK